MARSDKRIKMDGCVPSDGLDFWRGVVVALPAAVAFWVVIWLLF